MAEIRRRRVELLLAVDARTMDDLLDLQAQKQELAGIQYSANLVSLHIRELEDEIAHLLEVLEGDDDV